MKPLLLMVSLYICGIANAKTYYISPSGSDNNPGTITQPWKTWERISTPRWNNILQPGDIVYIRGGNYASPHANDDVSEAVYWTGINGTASNYITIQAYPGEYPILNCSNMTDDNLSYPDKWMLYMSNCSYVKVKGLHLTTIKQIQDGSGVSRGFGLAGCNFITLEQIEVDHAGGNGFDNAYSDDITYYRCDSHHNADSRTDNGADAFDNADGFNRASNPSTRTKYIECRSWLNCDDGWDFIDNSGTVTLDGCWSWKNGYYEQPNGIIIAAGNGEGFKLGFAGAGQSSIITRWLNNCVAFENRDAGFNNNGDPQTRYQLHNCVAYKNAATGFEFGYGNGELNTFKNNISYQNGGGNIRYFGPDTNNSNNTWNGGVGLTSNDFLSLSTEGVDANRLADGSLPNIDFLKLVSSSDLINKGIPVGLPYIGNAPDLGAFEFGTIIVPVTLAEFAVTEKSGKTLLQWSTVTEINSNHFEVERSIDGRNFETIGNVHANGNTNTRIDYQSFDYYPETGVNYYRLKIVDNDGQFEYSKTVSIVFKNTNSGSFDIKSAILNDKKLQLNVTSSKNQSVTIGLYDAIGRQLFATNILLQKGINNINKIVLQPSSVYYFKIKSSEETKTLALFNGE